MASLWEAKPHTLAKIQILRSFLHAWFGVHGHTARGQDLVYIDGFAGPGRYTNSAEGSPIAAMRAVTEIKSALGGRWIAGHVHMYFVEKERAISEQLGAHMEPFNQVQGVAHQVLNASFAQAVPRIETQNTAAFAGQAPLFAFVDPFGATGVPFSVVETLLKGSKSEVLINLDADGLARIFGAGASANAEIILTEVFGDESWRSVLNGLEDFRARCIALRDLYTAKLRQLPGVRYAYSFEMLTSEKRTGRVGYFLVFACHHPRAMQKMKEAMRNVDQGGNFQFSNARRHQPMLIRFDRPEDFSVSFCRWFESRNLVSYDELQTYALNETPFTNPKGMLKVLEDRGLIHVHSSNPRRRKGTFAEDKIVGIDFIGDCGDG